MIKKKRSILSETFIYYLIVVNMMDTLYFLLNALNIAGSIEQKMRPTKRELLAIATGIVAGLDASVVPSITGGQSVHELLGIHPQHEEYVRCGEMVLAYGGVVYHSFRNLQDYYRHRHQE